MRISRTTFGCARSFAVLTLVLGAAGLCSAASITYNINRTIGVGSVTGNIVTDGTLGVLGTGNILEWNLTLNDGTATSDIFGPNPQANVSVSNSDLTATATQLSFDFSGEDSGYLFLSYGGSPGGGVCFENINNCYGYPGLAAGETLVISYPNFQFTSVTGTQVIGTVSSTPEPSTLILLAAGISFFGFRKRGGVKR